MSLSTNIRKNQVVQIACYNFMLNHKDWFQSVERMIEQDLKSSNAIQRAKVILEWLKACDMVGSERVKIEIKKRYNQ